MLSSAERRAGEHGGAEERVLIRAGADEDARADHRSEHAGKAPRQQQHAVVGREILRAVEVAGERGVDRELRAVAVVDEEQQHVEQQQLLRARCRATASRSSRSTMMPRSVNSRPK